MTPTAGQISAVFSNAALAWAGAAAVAIPILIHLLTRFRRRRMVWAAMRFLAEAFRKQKRRLQIEQWLLLFVRCLIVLALAAALGKPVVRGLTEIWTGQPSGRFVCLVLDDSLSTRTRSDSGQLRFELLREAALSIVENLQPTDSLWVIRAARPWRQVAAPGDAAAVAVAASQAIESIKPRHSRADLVGVLGAVAARISDPDRVEGGTRPLVIVFSDFSAATIDLDRAMPQPIADLAKSATLLLAQPEPAASNVQLATLKPRRRLIVTNDDAPVVSVEMQLRRFAADRGETVTSVELELTGDRSAVPLVKAQRRHRWSPGQSVAVMNIELPIDAAGVAAQQLAVQGSITAADPGADRLEPDNRRLAVVELRKHLTVAVADAQADDSAYRPAELLRFMLAPGRASTDDNDAPGSPVSLIDVEVEQLDFASVEATDAAIVLRPDLLNTAGTAALGAFADRGGLVWLIAPAGDQTAAWATPLCQRLGLNWQVGVEPRSSDQPGTDGKDAPDDSSSATFWTLALEPPPEPLDRLGADWDGLLRPIWVRRILDVSDTGGQAQIWLSTARGAPLLMAQRRGDGIVLLLTAALDPDWTNLPVKKLFTPLFHDTLRSMVGSAGVDSAVCGSQPALHRRWENVQQLINSSGGAAVALKHGEDGVTPVRAFTRPGIYTAPGEAGGLKFAVNVDAEAGDTRAVDANRLKALLGGQWLDMTDPAGALLASRRETEMAWPLLWAVLALVLIETVLARWFSHAGQAGRGSL